jgi:C4-dicarboxylate transporter DctM subunit
MLFFAGLCSLGAVMLLVLSGMPIAFSTLLVGLFGFVTTLGWEPAFAVLGLAPVNNVGHYAFSVVPMFLLMGHLAHSGGLAKGAFRAARYWVGHLPGGLLVATVGASAAFASCCGASGASTAVLGKVAIPEMERFGYRRAISCATVAASGPLAMMIPPSNLLVIYGIVTEQSLAKLLIAGVLPGVIQAMFYMMSIMIRAKLDPEYAPTLPRAPWRERLSAVKGLSGVGLLAFVVLGGIYSGVFTPTEAASLGAFAALLLCFTQKEFLRNFRESLASALLETGKTTCMIFVIIVGIVIFTNFLALSGVTGAITGFIVNLPTSPTIIMFCLVILYLFLGMFLESIGMVLLTVPIILPAVQNLGFDPIWFGVFVVLLCETGLITPPVGVTVYIIKAVAGENTSLEEIFSAIGPFVICGVALAVLLILFPQIALFLPSLME